MGRQRIDLTGETFGRLTVIEYSGSKRNRAIWKVRCECGNLDEARADKLRAGTKVSCGCKWKEGRAANLITQNPRPRNVTFFGRTGNNTE